MGFAYRSPNGRPRKKISRWKNFKSKSKKKKPGYSSKRRQQHPRLPRNHHYSNDDHSTDDSFDEIEDHFGTYNSGPNDPYYIPRAR